MTGNKFTYILPILFLFYTMTSALNAPAPSPSIYSPSTEFIRAGCRSTRYPSLCLSSLARYASAIQCNPIYLACVATNISLARLHAVSGHIRKLHRAIAVDNRTAGALKDCMDTLGDAEDNMLQSTVELGKMTTVMGMEAAWQVSNVQTWMSAALTNEETCTDGFDGVGMGVVRAYVEGRVGRAKEYTSNALALVNNLVGR